MNNTGATFKYGDQVELTTGCHGEFRHWPKGTRGTVVAIASSSFGGYAYLKLTAWDVFDNFPLGVIRRLAPLELLAEAAE